MKRYFQSLVGNKHFGVLSGLITRQYTKVRTYNLLSSNMNIALNIKARKCK
nr:MAG TPA: hypothetical protein [Microviridae sp.]